MNKRYVPNALTICNLLCGCVATGAGFHHHFQTAFLFILIGAAFDFIDGYSARLLHVPSPMGVELDSLADVITFGLAPSAMLFTLFTRVRYPEFLHNATCLHLLPFAAFLLAAFSAYRLAKFNLDNRQRSSFIGMPTPACAIFWGALVAGCEGYLTGPMFNAAFLLAFELMFCFLLVCEIPMFSMKFHSYSYHVPENMVRYCFLLGCTILLFGFGYSAPSGFGWLYLCRGIAACMGLYTLINILSVLLPARRHAV